MHKTYYTLLLYSLMQYSFNYYTQDTLIDAWINYDIMAPFYITSFTVFAKYINVKYIEYISHCTLLNVHMNCIQYIAHCVHKTYSMHSKIHYNVHITQYMDRRRKRARMYIMYNVHCAMYNVY